ncbi:MAG: hypothetical protein ACYSUT_00195 [Planctomycetota bacterium]|jgi:hypothetical protein
MKKAASYADNTGMAYSCNGQIWLSIDQTNPFELTVAPGLRLAEHEKLRTED